MGFSPLFSVYFVIFGQKSAHNRKTPWLCWLYLKTLKTCQSIHVHGSPAGVTMWRWVVGSLGNCDPSPITVGWSFDVVVSLADRWSEEDFLQLSLIALRAKNILGLAYRIWLDPPRMVTCYRRQRCVWLYMVNGRDGGFGRTSCLCLVSGCTQGLVVDTCEFADLGLRTLGKMAEKRYGLVCYTLRVLFSLEVVFSNAMRRIWRGRSDGVVSGGGGSGGMLPFAELLPLRHGVILSWSCPYFCFWGDANGKLTYVPKM